MDQFALQSSLGYISPEEEVAILSDQAQQHPIDTIKTCASMNEVTRLKHEVNQVRISPEIKRYLVDIVNATRSAPGVQLGASPRASITLMKIAGWRFSNQFLGIGIHRRGLAQCRHNPRLMGRDRKRRGLRILRKVHQPRLSKPRPVRILNSI